MSENKQTILVVDDHPANLKVLLSFLQEHDFHIRVADSGERALKTLEDEQPDLVLLDIMMPGIDGFETCRQIKANKDTVDIPIIFMTALDSVEDKVLGFEAGGVDYITKPLQKLELLARVNTHLSLRQKQSRLSQALHELKIQSDTLEEQVKERTSSLRESHEKMEQQRQDIYEKNIALKVMLDQHQVSRGDSEDLVAAQLKKLVYPYIALLKQNIKLAENKEYVSLIIQHLDTIVGSFSEHSFSPDWKLTARESVVADLVKRGKNTKEIAEMLKISPRTAETYRNTIRKKVGLTNSKTRLRQFLCSTPIA